MKVTCGRCGKQLALVGEFQVTEKVFLDGLARRGWLPTEDPTVFVCRECRHAEGPELEEFARDIVAAYVALREEVAQLPSEEQEAAAVSRFAEVERLTRIISEHTGLESEIRGKVHELLRQLHGEEALAWIEATAQHLAQREVSGEKRNGSH